MSDFRDVSGYESDPEPGFSIVDEELAPVANIAGTTNDTIGGWTQHMMKNCDMEKPDHCCLVDGYENYQPCQRKVGAAAHMAFKGKDNEHYHRLVWTCAHHNHAREGDWTLEKAHKTQFPFFVPEGTPYLKIMVNRHFAKGSEEWKQYIVDNLMLDKHGKPKPIKRSKTNPHHTKQSRY